MVSFWALFLHSFYFWMSCRPFFHMRREIIILYCLQILLTAHEVLIVPKNVKPKRLLWCISENLHWMLPISVHPWCCLWLLRKTPWDSLNTSSRMPLCADMWHVHWRWGAGEAQTQGFLGLGPSRGREECCGRAQLWGAEYLAGFEREVFWK